MRRITVSIVIILALIVSVGGATLAVFTQSRSILGNTVSTARIDMDLRALSSGQIVKPINVSGLVPGSWTGWGRAEIYNTALSTPIKVYFYVDNVVGDACSKINFRLTTGHAGSDAGERGIDVYNGLISGVTGSGQRVEITGAGKIFNPTLPVNTTAVIQQRAQLDSSADNTYQNTTCTWDEIFIAETPSL